VLLEIFDNSQGKARIRKRIEVIHDHTQRQLNKTA
jgi:hypothetical protein